MKLSGGLVPDRKDEILSRHVTDVLQAVLLVREDVDHGSWAGCLALSGDGGFQSALADQHHLFVDVTVWRMRHLPRRQGADMKVNWTAAVCQPREHLTSFHAVARISFHRESIEGVDLRR